MAMLFLSNGMQVEIDQDDYITLSKFKWHARKAHSNTETIYAVTTVPRSDGSKYANGKTRRQLVQMHRLLMDFPVKFDVDHINGNGLDNRKDNLRLSTKSENLRNSKLNKRSSSGFKGVSYRGNAWRARIFCSGREISLGGFPTKERAAKAYDTAARTYFGKFARLNFPD